MFLTEQSDFEIKLVDDGTNYVHVIDSGDLIAGEWTSHNIALGDFSAAGVAVPATAELDQLVMDTTNNNSTFYIDDLYFIA